jgi:membrane dipeptidase
VGINFHRPFLSVAPPAAVTIDAVVDHILHVVKVGGIGAAALGSDFDGSSPPAGLAGAAAMQDLAAALRKRGLAAADVEKVMGGNALRVFAAVTGKKKGAQLNQMKMTVLSWKPVMSL